MSRDEVKRKITANPALAAYFGEEDTIFYGNPKFTYCGLYKQNNKITLLYRPKNIASEEEYSCEVPKPLQGIWSVKGPILFDSELSVKTYKTFDPRTVSNSQNQVWLMFDEYYYHEELGCRVGRIFCNNNPRSKPVHP